MTACNKILIRSTLFSVALSSVAVSLSNSSLVAQEIPATDPTSTQAIAENIETPRTRLMPIGAPSAVDQYRSEDHNRHTVRLMQFEAPQLPSGSSMTMPSAPTAPTLAPPVAPPTITPGPGTASPGFSNPGMGNPTITNPGMQTVMPPTSPPSVMSPTPPRGLPMTTAPAFQPAPSSSSSDLAPLAAPQLNDGFATIDNCCCVSAPSNYVAATGWGDCSSVAYQTPSPQAYIAPTTQVVGPAVVTTPTGVAPVTTTPVVVAPPANPKAAGIPKKPLLNFGQDKNPVVVGQGLVGQPVAYVPGQRFRNWIRYLFP